MSSGNATILEKKYKILVLQVSLTEVSFCIKDTLKDKIETIRSFSFDKFSNPTEIEESLIKVFNVLIINIL